MAEVQKKAKYDPWKDMVEVFIPKKSRGEQDTTYIRLNRRAYLVPKGKRTMVPRPVAKIIDRSLEMQNDLDAEAREDFSGSVTVAQNGMLDPGKLFR